MTCLHGEIFFHDVITWGKKKALIYTTPPSVCGEVDRSVSNDVTF
jgi:hypothetical protein